MAGWLGDCWVVRGRVEDSESDQAMLAGQSSDRHTSQVQDRLLGSKMLSESPDARRRLRSISEMALVVRHVRAYLCEEYALDWFGTSAGGTGWPDTSTTLPVNPHDQTSISCSARKGPLRASTRTAGREMTEELWRNCAMRITTGSCPNLNLRLDCGL